MLTLWKMFKLTVAVVVRCSNQLVLDEADRSLHDALCLIAGGCGSEILVSRQLGAWAKSLHGIESYCVKAFAEVLEVIPYRLAESAGLNPKKCRNHHAIGKGQITNMLEENVVQPLLISKSAVLLATECVRRILKIDDIVAVR